MSSYQSMAHVYSERETNPEGLWEASIHSLSLSLSLAEREWWVIVAACQAAIYMSTLWKRNRSEPVHTDSQGFPELCSLTLSLCHWLRCLRQNELPSSSPVTFCPLHKALVQIPGTDSWFRFLGGVRLPWFNPSLLTVCGGQPFHLV